jgi:hypothetical protein
MENYNNWTEKQWGDARLTSGFLCKFNINIDPRTIMEFSENELKICTDWLNEQWAMSTNYMLHPFAGSNPPGLLRPYIVDEDAETKYHCFNGDYIYRHHKGDYESYTLIHRGNQIDIWIDERRTGSLDFESEEFNGGEVEKQILIKEGYLTQDGEIIEGEDND